MKVAGVSDLLCAVQHTLSADSAWTPGPAEVFQEFCQIPSASQVNRDFALRCQINNPEFETTD